MGRARFTCETPALLCAVRVGLNVRALGRGVLGRDVESHASGRFDRRRVGETPAFLLVVDVTLPRHVLRSRANFSHCGELRRDLMRVACSRQIRQRTQKNEQRAKAPSLTHRRGSRSGKERLVRSLRLVRRPRALGGELYGSSARAR